jgi:hypothetical protein
MFLIYARRTHSNRKFRDSMYYLSSLTYAASTLNPFDMFDNDLLKYWSDGLRIYLNEYERCTYRFPSRDEDLVCCAVRGRNGHKMHIYSPVPGANSSARVLEAQGDFVNLRSWSDADQEVWLRNIKRRFQEMYHSAFANHSESLPNDPKRILTFRQEIHMSHKSTWNQLQSNETCLSYFQSVPDHVLLCGHSYCALCMQEIAKPSRSFECAFDMSACTLCGNHTHNSPHQIQLKPRCAGARVLTLDGGGIRGIVELALLRTLEKEIGLGVQISELFDLVVGTSTGMLERLANSLCVH